uniref:40S ribosomal protein S15 n=1 Tax=Heterosigma akashiwo TaxID=2829 RepID=A0A7S3UTD6_HETAK
MATAIDKERYEQLKKERTFYKFLFRGMELETLVAKKPDELAKLLNSRARRRFYRGLKRKPMALMKKLRKAKKLAKVGEKPPAVRTHLRDMIVMPEMVGSVVAVYNGHAFQNVEVKGEMIGHYLAEFALSYRPVFHSRPGVGSAAARFIPLK